MKIEDWGLDLQGIEDGRWLVVAEGFEVKARSFNSEQAVAFTKKHRRRDGSMSEEDTVRLLTEVVLVDWRGLTEKGVEIPYTPETGARILGDPRYALLVQRIVRAITSDSAYLEAAKEEAVKN